MFIVGPQSPVKSSESTSNLSTTPTVQVQMKDSGFKSFSWSLWMDIIAIGLIIVGAVVMCICEKYVFRYGKDVISLFDSLIAFISTVYKVENKRHSENTDTFTSVTFDMIVNLTSNTYVCRCQMI